VVITLIILINEIFPLTLITLVTLMTLITLITLITLMSLITLIILITLMSLITLIILMVLQWLGAFKHGCQDCQGLNIQTVCQSSYTDCQIPIQTSRLSGFPPIQAFRVPIETARVPIETVRFPFRPADFQASLS
jgi:hypothetical protein